jgi:beta propeller repeat protein
MKTRWGVTLFLFSMLLGSEILSSSGEAHGAQQYKGLCARVKMEIIQEMTLERVGFLATLEITNNEGDASITDFSASITFENPELSEEGNPNDASGLFFVQPPELAGIDDVNGGGVIPPTKTAVVRWFIIPKIDAGGTEATGVRYSIGAQLAGSIYAKEIAPEVLQVIPDVVTVRPEPQLEITYFQPRDVDGDDPFTLDVVESPIPFIVGCLVKNGGYGTAHNVKIESQQPRIVENKEALILIAQLLGSRVDDDPTDETSLTVNLGNIEPGSCRKCAWDMITSLSGEFIEFNASFTHASELGGEETSIIKDLNAYFIAREVKNDQPGRDEILDFLADTDNDEEMLPDTLFESDCTTLPVNTLTDVSATGSGLSATVTASADMEGWVYMRMNDPAQAKLPIESVVRSDGKLLSPHNCWTNIRYEKNTNRKLTYLNIFDFVDLGSYQYEVTYSPIAQDNDPPETRIRFSGEMHESGGEYYILPETQIYFTVEDASPVGTYYKLDGEVDFHPALPFTISAGGEHTVEYYSRDSSGNEEAHKFAALAVSAGYPDIQSFTLAQEEIFYPGDSISVLPSILELSFEGLFTSSRLDAEIDIFRGVAGWVTLSGVPSSPTSSDEATIMVGGENVDYYRYRLGNGSWSTDIPVNVPIVLSGLSEGTINLYAEGRSRYGGYLPDEHAVHASWVVDTDAPATSVSGAPQTPCRTTGATLQVSGADLYRYTIDGGYYRPEEEASEPIVIAGLEEGDHVVSVIGKFSGGEWQSQDFPTTVSWTVDRLYGYDFSSLPQIFHVELADVGGDLITYEWDGRGEGGTPLPPGLYTVRLTVKDELGRSACGVRLVRIGDLMPDGSPIWDGSAAGQINVYAFGEWAVWQDQRNGNWDIYALNVTEDGGSPSPVVQGPLHQERPKTDGKFVVWEDRQPDGSWDIWGKEIEGVEPAFAITQTQDYDEQKPAVYWPWVVYQSRPRYDPDAPWQLMVHNLDTGVTEALDPSTEDQLDPAIYRGKIVWQDFRDPGYGEIYLKDLRSGSVRKVTDDPYSQYHPAIYENWIVWSDKRNTQSDLYGYNLFMETEVQLTDTAENETRPFVNGSWVVYEEDSQGVSAVNLRILHFSNRACLNLTNDQTLKEKPALASGKVVWQAAHNGSSKIMMGSLPNLQAVFKNMNAVALTEGMASRQSDAFTLLRLWNTQAGVQGIMRYSSLVPVPVVESADWENGQPSGVNFALEPGDFVWVRFADAKILHLGQGGGCTAIDLYSGTNVFSYWCFPDHYSAFSLIRELGEDNIQSVRMLDAGTGTWTVAAVENNSIIGEDFIIPRVAVLMLEMKIPVDAWTPGG